MYNRRYRKCHCMNNNYDNNCDSDVLEDKCDNICTPCQDYNNDECECGFDEELSVFPSNPMLGQSYVPFQYMDKTFRPCVGLKMGTIFPELVSPYSPGQSMQEIAFIEATNKIGEGCNTCR